MSHAADSVVIGRGRVGWSPYLSIAKKVRSLQYFFKEGWIFFKTISPGIATFYDSD